MLFNENLAWEVSLIGLSLTAFTLVHVLSKPRQHLADILLCIWLLLLNTPFMHNALSHFDIDAQSFRFFTNPTLNLLHGPLLYFYLITLLQQSGELKRRAIVYHLTPFICLYLLFISFSHPAPMIPSPDRSLEQLQPVSDVLADRLFSLVFTYFGVINGLVFLAYSFASIRILNRHQRVIGSIFSQNHALISLKWIYALPALVALLVVLNASYEGLIEQSTQTTVRNLQLLSFLCFVTLLCFFGVKQKPLYNLKTQPAKRQTAEPETLSQAALETVLKTDLETALETALETQGDEGLSEQAIAQIIADMQQYMAKQKPYLDADFSVYRLAEALALPRRTLSFVLNKGLGKNFYQYVNEYRIEEVRSQLQQDSEKKTTLLDLAFASGFKSKSSFNSLFKQHCGVTPSQYRKALQEKQP